MVVTEYSEHLPHRPRWDCLSCGRPFPCDPARERLVTEFGRGPSLGMYCADYLHDFLSDTPGVPPTEAHERFLGWVRTPSVQDAS